MAGEHPRAGESGRAAGRGSDKEFISEEDLPLEFHFAQLEPNGAHGENLFEDATNTFERNFILRALEKCGWNVTATAEYLGIPLSTLKYKMDKLDVRQVAKRSARRIASQQPDRPANPLPFPRNPLSICQ